MVFHSDEFSESKQQAEFVKVIKEHAREQPADLYRAFEPFIYLPKAVGEWTKVTPDARICEEDGEKFFKRIYTLQTILEKCESPEDIPTTKKVFQLIDKARYFIYLVRNNIFHGAKTLGEVYESSQKRRIEVYDLFLKGLTSLFFLSVGKTKVSSDFVQCSIPFRALPISHNTEILDQHTVWQAINRNMMKIGDPRLIAQFTKQLPPPQKAPNDKAALFYPSSGCDLLTPLLIGLPYCTQFYFFERGQRGSGPPIIDILQKIPTVKCANLQANRKWKDQQNDFHYLKFEFNGLPKEIFWVHSDNKEFLKKNVELTFYFHRGDGSGEGGSGQKWDSELAPNLIKMIPKGESCIYLTDGVYGGIDKSIFGSSSFQVDLSNLPTGEASR